jgi:hypothetical protein
LNSPRTGGEELEAPYVTRPSGYTRDRVLALLTHRLIQEWFPNNKPHDLLEWLRIAECDAEAVLDELISNGLIELSSGEEND